MHACQVYDKADGTADVPAEVSDEEGRGNAPAGGNGAGGEGNGAHEGGGNAGGENGGDGAGGEGGNGAGGEGGGDGGDGNGGDGGEPHPEGEDEDKEEDEEEQKERDPDMPETPAGESSSSEEDWVRQGYSRDDILQKRHQKEMRRNTAQSALKALDRHQEDFDQGEMTKHMDRSLQKERLLKEIEVRRKQEEQLKRREEVLKAIEEKEKEKEKKIQQANEEIKEMHLALVRSEQEAEEELRAAEEREKREKAKGLDEKAVEVPLMAVKMEEEDDVEPLQELSSLRMCGYCHQKMYLRKGLCANLLCSAFYMKNPRAPELLCAKGPIHHGAKWSPGEWQSSLKNKVESKQLSMAMNETWNEWGEELAIEMRQQKETPAPIYHEAVIIEDLESGERVEHGPKKPQEPEGPPPLSSMTESYKEALTAAAKGKRNRGVKRLLSLHAAICQKKQRGEWVGSQNPIPKLSLQAQQYLDDRVKKAIESAPWRQ